MTLELGRTRNAAAALLLSLFAACGDGPVRPKPVPLDRVNCARCGMMISDDRNAAQLLAPGEDPLFYDDIGCLAADSSRHTSGAALFVRGSDGRGWLAAESSFYGRLPGLSTPMGYGFAAFASPTAARSRDREGRSLSWKDLLTQLEKEKRP